MVSYIKRLASAELCKGRVLSFAYFVYVVWVALTCSKQTLIQEFPLQTGWTLKIGRWVLWNKKILKKYLCYKTSVIPTWGRVMHRFFYHFYFHHILDFLQMLGIIYTYTISYPCLNLRIYMFCIPFQEIAF